MPGLLPMIGRRHFLASAAVGAIGVFVPLSGANAATTPPSSPSTETLNPTQPAQSTTVTVAESALVGTAAADQSGDTSVRPFKYHATDQELAELKRRIRETRWPERETVNDNTQGVQLALR